MAEHALRAQRTRLGALPTRAWDSMGPRMLRPLIGGAVGAAIVVLFLAIRGGTAVELNELTGTAWGRLEPSRRRASADRGQRGGGVVAIAVTSRPNGSITGSTFRSP